VRRAPGTGDYPPIKAGFSLQFVARAIQVRGSLRLLVLLILAAVWALVLGPSLLRRRFERRSSDSIGSYHRHLRVLGRAGPTLVDPAYRLRTELPRSPASPLVGDVAETARWHEPVADRPGLIVVRPDARRTLRSAASDCGGREQGLRLDPFFRPEASKRRRDVLMVLGCAVVVTGLLGALPALRLLLVGTAVFAVALAAYVTLMVVLRNRALERVAKLRYLPRPVERETSVPTRRAAAR